MRSYDIDKDLTLFWQRNYPFVNSKISKKKHTCVIGIGGNVGDVRARFKRLFFTFIKNSQFDIVETSPILQNPPFGYIHQNDFFNAVIVLKTNLKSQELLKYLLYIEKIYKRERFFKDSPRTLDLDIIFFDKISLCKTNLTIPHPHFQKRDSVMIPLSLLSKEYINEIVHIHRRNSRCRFI